MKSANVDRGTRWRAIGAAALVSVACATGDFPVDMASPAGDAQGREGADAAGGGTLPAPSSSGGGESEDAAGTAPPGAWDAGAPTGGGDGTVPTWPDAAVEPPIDAGPPRTIFVSSAVYTGNLGGLAGADTKCQDLASAARLTGAYKAWLSDESTGAATRLTHGLAPYRLVDGTVVASGWSRLVGGTLLHAIDVTELGHAAPAGTAGCGLGTPVWTATGIDGQLAFPGLTCSSWTGSAGQGAYFGLAGEQGNGWTAGCFVSAGTACDRTAALYCVEQ